jgi:predicted Zn-dependent protease
MQVMRRRCINNAEERLKRQPDDTRALYLSANAMVAVGEVERGLERASAASELDPNDCMLLYNVGCIFSLAGRTEEAMGYIERSVMVGNIQKRYYQKDSNLDSLRSHPRFEALMATIEKRQPG